jgi:hypothetical protein
MTTLMRPCAGAIAPIGRENAAPALSPRVVRPASLREARPPGRRALSREGLLRDIGGVLRYRGAHGANRISNTHTPLAKRHSSNATFEHPAV